jgi:hypothetical protein
MLLDLETQGSYTTLAGASARRQPAKAPLWELGDCRRRQRNIIDAWNASGGFAGAV